MATWGDIQATCDDIVRKINQKGRLSTWKLQDEQ